MNKCLFIQLHWERIIRDNIPKGTVVHESWHAGGRTIGTKWTSPCSVPCLHHGHQISVPTGASSLDEHVRRTMSAHFVVRRRAFEFQRCGRIDEHSWSDGGAIASPFCSQKIFVLLNVHFCQDVKMVGRYVAQNMALTSNDIMIFDLRFGK